MASFENLDRESTNNPETKVKCYIQREKEIFSSDGPNKKKFLSNMMFSLFVE